MNLKNLKSYGLAVVSGALWFLACPPYPLWWAAYFAMVPLFFALEGRSGKSAFFVGLTAGFVAMMGGFPWITDLIVRFGSLPWIVAFPICALYNLYQGIIFGIIAVLFTWFRDNTDLPPMVHAPISVMAVEYAFPLIFPWYFAITQAFVPGAIQVAEFGGPIMVSALLILSSSLIFSAYEMFREKRFRKIWLAFASIMVVALLWSQWRLHDVEKTAKKAPHIGVAMIQPMIGIHTKGQRYFGMKQLAVHQKLSGEAESLVKSGQFPRLDLLVWSESSYPYHIHRNADRDFLDSAKSYDMRKIRRGFTTPLFMGAGTADISDGDRKVYNSAILLDREGKIRYRYDKNWLLVFGEYIPFYDQLTFMHSFFKAHRMSNMSRGTSVNNLTLHDVEVDGKKLDVNLGPMICYEDILPEYSNRLKKLKPNVLVNITNDAWFGATQEPWQHLALAVFRSVETRLPLVRNVNIGVSAFISPSGRMGVFVPSADPQNDPEPTRGINDFAAKMRSTTVEKKSEGVYKLASWPGGYIVYSLVPVMSHRWTFFTTFGNIFNIFALLAVVVIIVRKKRQGIVEFLKAKILRRKNPETVSKTVSDKSVPGRAKGARRGPSRGRGPKK
ncbi:apolipoprotein N-acyltransferase [Myxococcota bacterium]|nr:apolipoprotein N-acyltransferase [Myxococcota bacterium]MBU1381026.1 apolipoprotein N-acyltransferase [Myxococcota bacterium]MBU1499077.1 apolipoprotein N-acyltransferase [Myxococcota bacterium]